MAFSMKIHMQDTPREIIAACDLELIDKILTDKDKDIEIKVKREFYGDEEFEWEEISERIKRGTNVNLLGNNIVNMAIKEGIINENSIITIAGVKHAQIYAV